MRLLHLIPTLVRGGAEKQMTLLATGLPRAEFEVHVAVLTHSGPYEATLRDAGIPVTILGKRWKIDPSAYWRLRRFIADLRPDVVQTWLFAANAYGRAAALSAGVKTVVASERCVDPWKAWHQLAIDRWLARRTARIVTNSSGVSDFYVRHGLPAEKFVVIPNGIAEAATEGVSRDDLLRSLGLPRDARLIGAVGRLWPQKRYKDLIWAAELLKVVRSDTHLVIVGDGPQRWRLERFRDQVQIGDRVHFLGERNDVPQLLPHLDCFWLGSGYEGQSNALMEAMLAGVPVVASDIPGNRDLIVPGESGLLFPVGDRAGLARSTLRILESPALAQQLGQAARQRMQTEFSVPRMIERYAEFYRTTQARGASEG